MNILIFSPGYPESKATEYPFVKQLVDSWALLGHYCTVISPFSVTNKKRFCRFHSFQSYGTGGCVEIFRPNVISMSNKKFFGIDFAYLFFKLGYHAAYRRIHHKQDFIYCHFWKTARYGSEYAVKNNLPFFVATGESDIKKLLRDIDTSFTSSASGVVCVSSKNRDESVSLGLTTFDKCQVFPNAINSSIFKKLDKVECRNKLNIPQNFFVIICVGAYRETKGQCRVVSAIQGITGKPVYSIFVGFGEKKPVVENMLFEGRLKHEEIPLYLNAADVFVLPTLAEGCCNAVIEAMACGLPVISSNLPFNWDVLDSTNSILVDPLNIDHIRDAIVELRDNPSKRDRLSKGALFRAEKLGINERSRNILKFIESRLEGSNNN